MMIDINDAVTIVGGEQVMFANRYRVVRQLGHGGMGSVSLVADTQLDDKLFAIKMLPSILVSNKNAYRQLKDEALVAMKLTHPNIVTLRAFEEDNGNPFLVMDYVEGQTLDDYLKEKGKLSEEETVALLGPVAAALDYAHSKGVVHRDVKPGNVMVAADGTPYILDFGIAHEMQETMTRVAGKLSSGTLHYMSPEQLRGEAPKVAQDIYSFSSMVYKCLSGHPPFHSGQVEHQILNEKPEPLTGFACAEAVMAGLAKKPEDRPATCSEVLDSNVSKTSVVKQDAPSLNGGVGKVLGLVAILAVLVGGVWCYQRYQEPVMNSHTAAADRNAPKLQLIYAEPQRNETAEIKAKSDVEYNAERPIAEATKNFKNAYSEKRYDVAAGLLNDVDRSDSLVQFCLGYMYVNGFGVAKNEVEAAKWFRQAAEHGDVNAQHNLGVMYGNGQGVPKDAAEAVKWYRKAAEQGLADTQKNLGVMYYCGYGVEKDYAEAVKWFRKAAEQGQTVAQNNLGAMYENGYGVGNNHAEAVKWFRKAAEQGQADAQYNLGVMYENGQGVSKDKKESLMWYRKAAEQGYADAQEVLQSLKWNVQW
jgi:TPR repeat protein